MKYMDSITAVTRWYSVVEKDIGKDIRLYKDSAFQYTKLHVVDEILKTGYLHATSMKFLNDTAEYSYAYNILNRDKKLEKDFEFFSISFTKKKDDVPQYMIYAGEIGVCIEYDFSFEKWGKYEDILFSFEKRGEYEDILKNYWTIGMDKPVLACHNTFDEIGNFNISVPLEIAYSTKSEAKDLVEKYQKALEKEKEDSLKKEEREAVEWFIPCFIKSNDFKSEEEVRLAVAASIVDSCPRGKGDKSSGSKYRGESSSLTKIEFIKSENKLLKPYMQLFFIDGHDNIIGWPIKSIWVGPGRDQERAFQSTKLRMETGDIIIFPLPLTELLLRIIKFYLSAAAFLQNEKFLGDNITDDDVFNMFEIKDKCDGEFQKIDKNDEFDDAVRQATVLKIDGEQIKLVGANNYLRCMGLDERVSLDAKKITEKFRMAFQKKIKNILREKVAPKEIGKIIKNELPALDVKDKWVEDRCDELINEFEKYNYFSSIGISVHRSIKNLAQY